MISAYHTKHLDIRQRALAMWLKGMTFTAVARAMGVSRQWVHEMLVPPKDLRQFIYNQAGGKCQDCGVHLGRNGHYHSIDDGPIDDFTKPLILLCLACHRPKHDKGGCL